MRNKLPYEKIVRSLMYSELDIDINDPAYRRARMADTASCVFCPFQTWNRQTLKEHYQSHTEIIEFRDRVRADEEMHSDLVHKRDNLKRQIELLRNQYVDTHMRLEDFDMPAHRERQRQAERLLELIGVPRVAGARQNKTIG